MTTSYDADREQVLRDKAVRQLKKRRDFRSHLLVYVLVNTFLVVIWVVAGGAGSSGRCSPSPGGASA